MDSPNFNVLFGNAIGKFTELKTIISKECPGAIEVPHPILTLLAHQNLTPFVNHCLIQLPGGAGHKIRSVIISNPEETHDSRVPRWN
ncbi:hypothetical protein TNCV_2560191 [Trichonephila clavipes]|uniref:Uncharacterized protein n=1 Tax=Trichonephila clavipes TaxID=2585209 RepID=A0A8X6R5D4_TRICX|nr:hypothetical protein TNCV_2560191 [Trichonephila clavipes]